LPGTAAYAKIGPTAIDEVNGIMTNRRTVLGLLGGSAAYGVLPVLPGRAALAEDRIAAIADRAIEIQFDSRLHSRIIARFDDRSDPLTAFGPSEFVVTEAGLAIDDFASDDHRIEYVTDIHGRGTRHTLQGVADVRLEKTVQVTLYERYPGFAFVSAAYRNVSDGTLSISRWVNGARRLIPSAGESAFWSYSGASYEDRRDWVQPAGSGFTQRNFMGMNASDYGGGTPIVDVWRRDAGMAVGHVESHPRLLALPLEVTAEGASIAVDGETAITLAPGDKFDTPQTFVAIHRGDYFATLATYREVMADQGLRAPKPCEGCYEPVWCAWGYERDFTIEQVVATLPKARELGLVWAGVDDGWQISEGDWYLDPKKFPRGDADMIALVQAIKNAGMKPKLWVAPLAVDPGTDLLHDASDLLLLNEDGSVRDVTWWNSFYLCPAYPPTLERSKTLVRRILGDWGFMGLKIDGQHLNGAAPCYNPIHKHARPEESFEKLQDFWKTIYETAISINPEAVVEICPCGTSYAFHNMPAMNQTVASDPESSWQVRLKGKTIKALMGPSAAYTGDHVELSDHGDDFASSVGIGANIATKFTWPDDPRPENGLILTPAREILWRKWIALYNSKMLSKGDYRGDLYDIGFDQPEAHVVAKGDRIYYAFYADRWDGPIELRGLGARRYALHDYFNDRPLGTASPSANRLQVAFKRFLLLEATPLAATQG
jgi:alpha-galactosidase